MTNIRDIEFVKEQERKRKEYRKSYQHDYYMRVTKPKRQAAKKGGSSKEGDNKCSGQDS